MVEVVVLDLDHGASKGLAVTQNLTREHVASVVAEGAREGDNFGLQAQGPVPALLLAKGSHNGLRVVYDVAILGWLPVGYRLHREPIDAWALYRVLRLPCLVVQNLCWRKRRHKILRLAIDMDCEGLWLCQGHAHHFHGMGEGEIKGKCSVLLLLYNRRRGDDHAKMGQGRGRKEGEGKKHERCSKYLAHGKLLGVLRVKKGLQVTRFFKV